MLVTARESPIVASPSLPEANDISPADRLALLASSRSDLPEITRRRQAFRDVRRFFGLDIHREYLLATAVDGELQVVYGPRRVEWAQFDAWAARTLDHFDAIVVEMTTNTWQVYDDLVARVHSVTVVHPPHIKLITQSPVTPAHTAGAGERQESRRSAGHSARGRAAARPVGSRSDHP